MWWADLLSHFPEESEMARAIGIDLGTTNSVVAYVDGGQPVLIPDGNGDHLVPSVVALREDGCWLVGKAAREEASSHPDSAVASVKRRMGSGAMVRVGGREMTPQQVSGLILKRMKTNAESYLGHKVDRAVITVPAYFNESQRQATKEAGYIAGLDVMRILSEPTAAALAYGLDRRDIHHVVVWDLGGGTFDVSVLELGRGVFDVKAVAGNTRLGGDDWDQRVADYLAEVFYRDNGVDPRQDSVCRQKLKDAAERAKKGLSSIPSARVSMSLPVGEGGRAAPLDVILRREEFERMTEDLLQAMVGPAEQALADAGLRPEDIDRVILVGGATRMPAVQRLCRAMLGRDPCQGIDPDRVVAVGAAIEAAVLGGDMEQVTLLDVIPLSLGIETRAGVFTRLIDRNSKIPISVSQVFSTAFDGQTEVDVHVLQGERAMACDNVSLGEFQLVGIAPLPRGEPRLEVCFRVDSDGILHVEATDLHTGNQAGIRVQSPHLSDEEIARMVEEAREWTREDERRQREAVLGIRAGNLIDAVRRMVDDAGSGLVQSPCEAILRGSLELEEALSNGDLALIDEQTVRLQETLRDYAGRS